MKFIEGKVNKEVYPGEKCPSYIPYDYLWASI